MSSGRLGYHKALTAGVNNVYQCPDGYYSKIVVNVVGDITGSAKVKLFISPTNTPLDTHVVQVENLNSVNNGFIRSAVIMSSGEWLSYYSSVSNITVSVNGVELPTNNKEIAIYKSISTNTEEVLYEVANDKVSTINATISSIGDTVSSSSNVKLYVSNTNASGGSLLYNGSVNSSRTGFEYTGLILSSGQKLILVTTNIAGTLSTRVQGFTRDE